MEAEGREAKRLRFDKEGEVRETPARPLPARWPQSGWKKQAPSSSQDKGRGSPRAQQHCTEEEDEEDEEEEESFMTPREMIPERKIKKKNPMMP